MLPLRNYVQYTGGVGVKPPPHSGVGLGVMRKQFVLNGLYQRRIRRFRRTMTLPMPYK